MDTTLQKKRIIELLQQVEDADLLKAVKALLDFSMKKESQQKEMQVPAWHKPVVRKRIAEAKKHPESLLTWDEVMNELDS